MILEYDYPLDKNRMRSYYIRIHTSFFYCVLNITNTKNDSIQKPGLKSRASGGAVPQNICSTLTTLASWQVKVTFFAGKILFCKKLAG